MSFKLSHSLWSQGCYNCPCCHLQQSGKGSEVEGISHMPCVTYSSCIFLLGLGAGKERKICLEHADTGTPEPPRMETELKLSTMTHVCGLILWFQHFDTQQPRPHQTEWDVDASIQKILEVFSKRNQIVQIISPSSKKGLCLTLTQ